ncbi:hypothetical protein A2165_03495, partial [Candidatus Curtissbacteria bacterium RBG_13_40_7]
MDILIKETLESAKKKIIDAKTAADLDKVYLEIFGKSGKLARLTKQIGNINIEKRSSFGQSVNTIKKEIEEDFEKKRIALSAKRSGKSIDITAPGQKSRIGHLHLVTQAMIEIIDIFKKLGFTLQSYPEVEWDWYAFEALNMPKDHPARDDWETFFIKFNQRPHLGGQVLTPHTSNGQVREMERVKKPPIRMLNISRCYRRQIDISHTPMFHQFEGLLIDKNVSIPHLKGIFDFFISSFFGPQRKSRLRPYHFRFTEPSFEVDVTCSVCMGRGCRLCKDGWLELGGAGMI